MDRLYLAEGLLLLTLFTYAQYYGFSVIGSDEDKAAPHSLNAGVYHK